MRNGYKCARGDETFAAGDVLSHIVRQIVRARIVIANIGTRNPNVYYELGIAQAIGKPTILVSHTIEGVPFDVQSQRILIYATLDELEKKIDDALIQTID